MCGIAGALRPERVVGRGDLREIVARMTTALEHRGPDGHGVSVCTPAASLETCEVAFGHTRLAIIDLTEGGAQPMSADDRLTWLTFNGEIYNFRELKESLTRRGCVFRSTSDTEVILRGYEEWGEEVFERLEGMFALAIWDGRQQRLKLTRDRLGIKPLYLFAQGTIVFASEVRALLACGMVPKTLDPVALNQFLAYQTVPSPRTLVRDVRLIDPGAVVTFDKRGQATTRTYWNLLDSASRNQDGVGRSDIDEVEIRATVHGHLSRAVRSHMVSDVPVGVFLSGGIDSSALVSLLSTSGFTPQTFTVAFPGHGVDEAPYARAIASAFGTDHSEIELDEAEVVAQVRASVETADHPSGDGVNTYVVAKAVRNAGVKVAVSGLGGDEFFGGYPSFRRFEAYGAYARAWQYSPRVVRRVVSSAVRSLAPESAATEKAVALLESDGSVPQAVPIMRQLFTHDQRRGLLSFAEPDRAERAVDPYVALLEQAFQATPGMSLMASISYAESRTYMHDVLLRDADQMSMRHALEVRVPLLDHRLVECLMGLPDSVKQPGEVPKRLLRDSLGAPLPSVCVDRPKRGFVLPFDTWMRTSLRDFCDHHLGHDGLCGRAEFQPAGVHRLWTSFLDGGTRTTWARPWALVALSAWMENTGVSL